MQSPTTWQVAWDHKRQNTWLHPFSGALSFQAGESLPGLVAACRLSCYHPESGPGPPALMLPTWVRPALPLMSPSQGLRKGIWAGSVPATSPQVPGPLNIPQSGEWWLQLWNILHIQGCRILGSLGCVKDRSCLGLEGRVPGFYSLQGKKHSVLIEALSAEAWWHLYKWGKWKLFRYPSFRSMLSLPRVGWPPHVFRQ